MIHTPNLLNLVTKTFIILSSLLYLASGVSDTCNLPQSISNPFYNVCNPFTSDYERQNPSCLPPNLVLTCVFDNSTLSQSDLELARAITSYANLRAQDDELYPCTQDGQTLPLYGCASENFCQSLSQLNTLGLLQNWGNGCCGDNNCNGEFDSNYLVPFLAGTNLNPPSDSNTNEGNNINNSSINSGLQCYQSQNNQIPTSASGCADNSLCIQIPAGSPCSLLQQQNGQSVPGLPSDLQGQGWYGCVPVTSCLQFSTRADELACAVIFDLCCGDNGCNRPQELDDAPIITTTRFRDHDDSNSAVGLIASFSLLIVANFFLM